MLTTYKNFKMFIEGFKEEVGFSKLSDLSEYYKETGDQRCIAYCFVNQFGILYNKLDKFPYLESEDRVSLTLREIEKALIEYNPKKGAQLQTLICNYAYRRCYAENNSNNCQKRRINYDNEISSSYEAYVESGIDWGIEEESVFEYMDWVNSLDLNKNEEKYCKILGLENHTLTDSEVAKEMGVTCATVHYIKKRLRTKLQVAF